MSANHDLPKILSINDNFVVNWSLFFGRETPTRLTIFSRNCPWNYLVGASYPSSNFSCALVRDILVQGRLFLTPNYCCFHSNILRWETSAVIPFTDIKSISKEKTIKIIPNAISGSWIYKTYCSSNNYPRSANHTYFRPEQIIIFQRSFDLKNRLFNCKRCVSDPAKVVCHQNKYIFTSFTARDRALHIFTKFWKFKVIQTYYL